jgi:GST-like protein
METKRQLDVLDKHLAKNKYMIGDTYTVADIAIWSWYGQLALDRSYNGSFEFLDMQSYTHVTRWAKMIWERPAVQRGVKVNKTWGPLDQQLWERHDASDFETETQDKKTIQEDSVDENKEEEENSTSSPKIKYPKRMSENMFTAPMSKKVLPQTDD